MNSDLNAPLGRNRKQDRRSSLSVRGVLRGGVIGCLAVLVVAISISPYVLGDGLDPAINPAKQKLAIADVATRPEATGVTGIVSSGRQDGANVERQVMDDGSVVTKFTPRGREGGGPLIIDAQPTQDPRLGGLPNDDLLEETAAGKLPVVGPDGLRPFDYYARPWSGARGTRIAIVVGGLGISQTGTMRAVRELPEEITLAFAANGNSLGRWVLEARQNGHEVLLQVPMEPFGYPENNPGRGTLVTSKPAVTNMANLHEAMARVTSYTGVMNYLGGRFLASVDSLEPVMRDIADRGLMFLDDGTSAQSLSDEFGRALSMPHALADVVLDGQVDADAIAGKLDELERIAYRKGQAIGVASAFDESLDAISKWAEKAGARGIEIVGVSALAENAGR